MDPFKLLSVPSVFSWRRFGYVPFHSAAMNSWNMPTQDSMTNEQEYTNLGLNCADICKVLDRGTNERKLSNLSQSVCEAINQLMTWVNPVMHTPDSSLTPRLTVELLRRSRGRSSNGGSATQLPDFFRPRTIRPRLLLGGQNSIEFFTSLMCVQPPFSRSSLMVPLSDRINRKHPWNGFRHPR